MHGGKWPINSARIVVYGTRLESVLDRVKRDISLDLLSRVLADLHQDSSKLIGTHSPLLARNHVRAQTHTKNMHD